MCVLEPQRQILPSEFGLCWPMGTYSLGKHSSCSGSPRSGGDRGRSLDGVLHTKHRQSEGGTNMHALTGTYIRCGFLFQSIHGGATAVRSSMLARKSNMPGCEQHKQTV